MIITKEEELHGMQKASEAVAQAFKTMREAIRPGMSAKELDELGGKILAQYGAHSAPRVSYKFPGHTCISVNHEVAHGIPKASKIFKEGDLVNIDVSASLNGYFSDNGGSFVLGNDIHDHTHLVETSRTILYKAIDQIKGGVKVADLGRFIEHEAKKAGYKVIRNLVGHGIGRALHEDPKEIPCFHDRLNLKRFKKNSVVALETFISTGATQATETGDGWTLHARSHFVAQHEHTILITDDKPVILTMANGI